jgi:hypothetical protein
MLLKKALAGVFVALILGACSTDFQLEAEYKDIPVVYAFISKQDTAHYIRLEKAFLQPGGNANQIAQIADSIYYAKAIVQLEKVATGQRFTLTRVDGAREGYPRQDGPFAKTPNYLYKIKANQLNLKGGEQLKLLINRGEGKALITAQTTVVSDLALLDRPGSPIAFIDYNRQISFSWNTPVEAKVFDVRLRLYYRETTTGNNYVNKTLEWVLKSDLERSSSDTDTRINYTITGEQFFKFIADNIDATQNRRRIFDGMDFLVNGAGSEMVEFLRISRANTGITSSQVVPMYTNIPNGVGIFTSRSTAARKGLQITAPTADSLRAGKFTRQLNFQ